MSVKPLATFAREGASRRSITSTFCTSSATGIIGIVLLEIEGTSDCRTARDSEAPVSSLKTNSSSKQRATPIVEKHTVGCDNNIQRNLIDCGFRYMEAGSK